MAAADATRVMVVDDHPVTRRGLLDILADEEGFELVGEAADGVEAVRVAQETRPDVVVMDLFMPGRDGAEACREIMELLPGTRVLMLTASAEEDDVIRAVAAGATGFLRKFTGSDELVHAVRQVADGDLVVPQEAVRRAFALLGSGCAMRPAPVVLSPREREALTRFARGRAYAQIAKEMGISKVTVRNAIYRVQNKLGVGSHQEMVVWAVRNGLLDGEEDQEAGGPEAAPPATH